MPLWPRSRTKTFCQRGGGLGFAEIAFCHRRRHVVDVLEQLGGQLLGRGHVIDQPGVDGAAGHAVELGRGGVLHHHHAKLLLDGPQAQRAVAAHPGENDADRLLLLVRGQVAEEEIDGRPQAPRRDRFEHLEPAVQDRQVGVGRNHVDAVRPDLHAVRGLDDRHLRVPPQQFRHHSLVRRLEVRHQDERQPGIGGKRAKNCSRASSPPADAPTPTI